MTHDEIISVIAAHRDGKVIQFRDESGQWDDVGAAPRSLAYCIGKGDEVRMKPPREFWQWVHNVPGGGCVPIRFPTLDAALHYSASEIPPDYMLMHCVQHTKGTA